MALQALSPLPLAATSPSEPAPSKNLVRLEQHPCARQPQQLLASLGIISSEVLPDEVLLVYPKSPSLVELKHCCVMPVRYLFEGSLLHSHRKQSLPSLHKIVLDLIKAPLSRFRSSPSSSVGPILFGLGRHPLVFSESSAAGAPTAAPPRIWRLPITTKP